MKEEMTRKILILCITVFFMYSSCASTPTEPPRWVMNLNEVYPNTAFITARGEGSTRREAETRAMTVIAQFFLSQVTSEQSSRSVFTTGQDGVTASERKTIDFAAIEIQLKLTAVRYAPDPWYDKRSRSWETVAYINREEAWALYEPNARRQSEALLNLIRAADAETEPFNAFLRYGNAAAYEGGDAYSGARLFSQVLSPTKANVLFAQDDAALSSLMRKRFDAREKSRIYIECPADHDRIIYQAAVKAVGSFGFAVEQNRNNTLTRALVQVDDGLQRSSSGSIHNASLVMTISGTKGSLFSFRVQGNRVGAVDADLAKRRAYTDLAGVLEKTFSDELDKHQKSLVRN